MKIEITPEHKLKLLRRYMKQRINKYPAPKNFTFEFYLKRYKQQLKLKEQREGKIMGGKCGYCGTIYTEQRHPTRDHIIPKAFGGTSAPHNLKDCCWNCNQWKGDKTLYEWKAEIEFLLQATTTGRVKLPNPYNKRMLSRMVGNLSHLMIKRLKAA